MGTIITGYLPAVASFGRVVVFDPRSAVAPRQELSSPEEAPSDAKVEGLNAYKVAVLLAVGAAILSCL